MPLTRRGFLGAVAASGPLLHFTYPLGASQDAAAQSAPPDEVRPGQSDLKIETGRDGMLYIPKGYKAGIPTPLVVAFHGAGGSGRSASYALPFADEFGFIVLAPDARQWTWDGILGDWGPDLTFIASALKQTVSRCSVDRNRLALAGFSDGASYALSMGIANGDVFGSIMAMSPGVMQPPDVNGKPRIFISHGTNDGTMPIGDTSRRFVPRLKTLGYDVTYREYEGRHTLPPEIARAAFEWFMRPEQPR
jgi:phospholipase/carboxylesterase